MGQYRTPRIRPTAGQNGLLDHRLGCLFIRTRHSAGQAIGSRRPAVTPGYVELLAAVAHDPTRHRDVAEFLDQL